VFTLPFWEKESHIDFSRPACACTVALPARFDFIGGWTDTPPYYFDHESGVLNATLVLHREKMVSVDIHQDDQSSKAIQILLQPAAAFTTVENGIDKSDLEGHVILRTVFEHLGLQYPHIALSINNSIPKGSGLGGSSLLAASLLASFYAGYEKKEFISDHIQELINNVLYIEQLMESGGGWQDQIGGIFPGIKLIRTTPNDACHYSLRYLDKLRYTLLNNNSLIIDSRIQRKASRILYSIRQKYIDNNKSAVTMLENIAHNAQIGFTLLNEGNLFDFASLLSESWLRVNEVEASSIESVEALKKVCGKDLIGVKIGGAGGGGFILAIFPDEEKREYYKSIIEKRIPESLSYYPVFGGSGLAWAAGEETQGRFQLMEEMEYV